MAVSHAGRKIRTKTGRSCGRVFFSLLLQAALKRPSGGLLIYLGSSLNAFLKVVEESVCNWNLDWWSAVSPEPRRQEHMDPVQLNPGCLLVFTEFKRIYSLLT